MASTTEITAAPKELDAGMMIRRALFLLVLVLLTLFYLVWDFKGLSTPTGMEQAQIARQIARGQTNNTKMIRPVALAQVREHQKITQSDSAGTGPSLMKMPQTYHAPLNPMFESMVLSINKDLWKIDPKNVTYAPDILLAGAAMVLLLSSIGVTYLLVSRIFDTRIGGVTAFLMLLCELLWRYTQSGLPQILMLFLFSFATYFFYKAVENTQQEKPVYLWMALAGGFFALLALSHWLTMWIFLGALMFAAFYFNPKGIQVVVLVGIFTLITGFWAYFNYNNTGDILGAGRYAFYAGLGDSSDIGIMRDFDQKSGLLSFDGFFRKTINNFIGQFTDLYGYLGSIIVAPLFFLSLLHPFRRKEIGDFRWCLLAMWIFGTIGMSIFGISPFHEISTDTNNLHILFIPLFTAYGLAVLSVLWNRLTHLPMHHTVVRNGHFIIAIFLSALPFLLNMPIKLMRPNTGAQKNHWPFYVPRTLAALATQVNEQEVIVTDIPWATAWYGDRVSIWLPKTRAQFNKLQEYAREKNEEVAGVLISPFCANAPYVMGIQNGEYSDWHGVILRLPVSIKHRVDTFQYDNSFPYKDGFWIGDGTILYTDSTRLRAVIDEVEKAK